MSERLTVIVAGMVAGDVGQGGATWAVLQYVLGLQRLGHDVYLVEPVVGEIRHDTAVYFRDVVERFGLEGRATLLNTRTLETVGTPYRQIPRRADLMLNLSGLLRDEDLMRGIASRVYVDLDPAFNQLWHEVEGIDRGFAGHTHYVTVGLALGDDQCGLPRCGLSWIPSLQPVVLAEWPVAEAIEHDAFTSVGNWRGYGSIEHAGVLYGQRAHSLRQLFSLPTRCVERFILALAIHPDEDRDLGALAQHGWELVDPTLAAGTPDRYRRFVAGSKAELGIAKSGYVVSRSGWFSDRSACYLASGRPVVAQDTGFSAFLPTGQGLFAFSTAEQALGAIDELRHDYPGHSRAARELAEEYFDSDRVLTRLLASVAS